MSRPFLTCYTPTYRRPAGLAACLESVRVQTAVAEIQHLVVPDHVGLGIGGMFQQIQQYAPAVRGQYVHILADDDVLASPTVVEQVQIFAEAYDMPPVIVVSVDKAGAIYPCVPDVWPPRLGTIDLGCILTRGDVWHAHVGAYGNRYEGDYDHMAALAAAGYGAARFDVLFLRGRVSHGAPEVEAAA